MKTVLEEQIDLRKLWCNLHTQNSPGDIAVTDTESVSEEFRPDTAIKTKIQMPLIKLANVSAYTIKTRNLKRQPKVKGKTHL